MNKKYLLLFIVFILAMGSVSAANFDNHDFDGYFTMDVPNGATFQKDINETNEEGIKLIMASYMNNDLAVMYMESPTFSENSSAWFYQSFFEAGNPDLTKCYERQEGNLKILEPTTSNEASFPIVGVSRGDKIVVITGKDIDALKQMGNSVEFK
ncbi:MAG: hypothetical protein E7Z77_06515 [Methanobrevibacter sp.]|uniref:hypothetical protein n=1 Tax=Methanobrevibacter sp. TaxID=66852 RepID=UPI0025EC4775|nr:hypothetical protein [Methanobrevibacter sp.]MBE6509056.1 hypothetical protein [Methanobrevibacter sp.]